MTIGTPSYKLAKLLVPKLSSITFNEFTVKGSFAFAEEIVHKDGKLFMGSLDADSLFTNIPLEKTINICTNLLYNNVDVTERIKKSEFENFLSLATQESYFMFKGCVRYIFARLFLGLNESPCQTRENVFYFTSKALFVLEKIKFQNFRFSNFMTSSNVMCVNESLLMKFGQFMSYSKRNSFIKKFYKNCGLKTSSRLFCVCKELSTTSIEK